MSVRQESRKRSEAADGFTLMELLMAISILGLILGTMGFAVTEGFRHVTTTRASIDRSVLGNFATRYFSGDVSSATYGPSSVVTKAANPTLPQCGVDAGALIDIQTGANTAVSYGTITLADGTKSFVRSTCTGIVSGAPNLTLVTRKHLGSTDSTFAPTVTCATSANNTTSCVLKLIWSAPASTITINGASWVNATTTTT